MVWGCTPPPTKQRLKHPRQQEPSRVGNPQTNSHILISNPQNPRLALLRQGAPERPAVAHGLLQVGLGVSLKGRYSAETRGKNTQKKSFNTEWNKSC